MSSDASARLLALVEVAEASEAPPADLAEGDQLAEALGGALGLRWRLAALRALLRHPPDDDSLAERYGALLDAARGEPAHLAQARALGDELRARQEAGELPRVMLARSPRRRRRD